MNSQQRQPIVQFLFWLHLVYLAVLPGTINVLVIVEPGEIWRTVTWVVLGLFGMPIWACASVWLLEMPRTLVPALLRSLALPMVFVIWWQWVGGSPWIYLANLFFVEWLSILLALLIPELGPASWTSLEIRRTNTPPKTWQGHVAKRLVVLMVLGPFPLMLAYLFADQLTAETGLSALVLTAVIITATVTNIISMLSWKPHMDDQSSPLAVLIAGWLFWFGGPWLFP